MIISSIYDKKMVEISKEQWAIAKANQIPEVTVYKRIQRGWDIEKAISTLPKKQPRGRKGGKFAGEGKGKPRSFRMPANWDKEMDRAIAESGLTESEWIAIALVNKLKRSRNKVNRP